MTRAFPPVKINFASVDVKGGPGLALVVIVVAIAIQFPEARWLLLSGLLAGAALGAVLILRGRRGRVGRLSIGAAILKTCHDGRD